MLWDGLEGDWCGEVRSCGELPSVFSSRARELSGRLLLGRDAVLSCLGTRSLEHCIIFSLSDGGGSGLLMWSRVVLCKSSGDISGGAFHVYKPDGACGSLVCILLETVLTQGLHRRACP